MGAEREQEPMESSLLSRPKWAVCEIALELARLDHQLAEVAATIPLPADFAAMNRDRVPKDVASHLWGTIHCVRHDLLSNAITSLRRAAQLSELDLRDEFVRYGRATPEVN